MLYLPKRITKFYIIVLFGLILFHAIFVESKKYTASSDTYSIDNVSEAQYQNYLAVLPDYANKTEFIESTEIEYFSGFPHESLFYIYLGYFLVATCFVLSVKIKDKGSSNEN